MNSFSYRYRFLRILVYWNTIAETFRREDSRAMIALYRNYKLFVWIYDTLDWMSIARLLNGICSSHPRKGHESTETINWDKWMSKSVSLMKTPSFSLFFHWIIEHEWNKILLNGISVARFPSKISTKLFISIKIDLD